MNPGDIIRDNSGYTYLVKRIATFNHLSIAVLECEDTQCPFVFVTGLRQLPSGRYTWTFRRFFASFPQCLDEFDVERVRQKNERYA